MSQTLCPGSTPNFLHFFDLSIAPNLLFYTYIPVIVVSLLLGFFVWRKDKQSLVSSLLFIISAFFSLWVLDMFVLWIGAYNSAIVFFWQITPILEVPLFIFAVYFTLVMTNKDKKDISNSLKFFFAFLMMVVFAFLPTHFNITSYDISNCEGIPGPFFFSMYGAEILTIFILLGVLIKRFRSTPNHDSFKKEILYVGISIISFLVLFTGTNIAGQLTSIQTISLWDSLGMVLFLGFLVYLIVRFHTFNIKLLATQALIWAVTILIGSQFFFIKTKTNFILTGFTFTGIIILGNFLVKSVKREVEQRERLEVLRLKLEESNLKLENANDKLKDLDKLKTEFLSLASHQLRSPLTAIKGYTSMVLEGDFGELNPQAKDAIERVFQSTMNLTKIVEDLLNVSKIEQGGMKFTMEPFNFVEICRDMAKDLSITAEKKGVKLVYSTNPDDKLMVNGDKEKLRQVVLNLIDNSIKYTKEGSIDVSVKEENGKAVFSVKDTGMGMTPEIKATLFQKFARGEGARMNTGGSGLGLYLAKEIIVAHKGTIDVESEGMGKGSNFHFELDLVK